MKALLWTRSVWSILVFIWFLLCVWVTWQLLASVHFLYPAWYWVLSIDEAIIEYAPANEKKASFELTTDRERYDLFASIVHGIQHKGRGLEEIVYHDSAGKPIDRLLTPAEVTHLTDVANLVTACNRAAVALFVLAGVWMFMAYRFKWPIPATTTLFAYIAAVLGVLVFSIVLLGPVVVFYWLHEKIFPQGHQWFFYYEESLMSLLMKAPLLFGPIAIMLLAGAVVLMWISLLLIRRASRL